MGIKEQIKEALNAGAEAIAAADRFAERLKQLGEIRGADRERLAELQQQIVARAVANGEALSAELAR